jgi:hypothetical protein
MENLIVILIVALAGVYLIRRFYKGSKQNVDSVCDCSSCHTKITCPEPAKEDPRDS